MPADITALRQTWSNVRDDKSTLNSLLVAPSKNFKTLELVAKGKGGLEEFLEAFDEERVMYGGLRCRAVDDRGTLKSVRSKFVLVTCLGDGVPTMQKAKAAMLKESVDTLFVGTHATFNISSVSDVTPEILSARLQEVAGAHKPSHYEFTGSEGQEGLVDKEDGEATSTKCSPMTSPKMRQASPIIPVATQKASEKEIKVETASEREEEPVKKDEKETNNNDLSTEEKVCNDEEKEADKKPQEVDAAKTDADDQKKDPDQQQKTEKGEPAPEPKPKDVVQSSPIVNDDESDPFAGVVGRDAIVQCWRKVKDETSDINWVMLQFDGKNVDNAMIYKTGTSGLEGFKSHLDPDKVLFCGLRCKAIDDRGSVQSVRAKFLFIAYIGSNVKPLLRAKAGPTRGQFEDMLSGTHVSLHVTDAHDIIEKDLISKLQSSTGAHKPTGYDFSGGKAVQVSAV